MPLVKSARPRPWGARRQRGGCLAYLYLPGTQRTPLPPNLFYCCCAYAVLVLLVTWVVSNLPGHVFVGNPGEKNKIGTMFRAYLGCIWKLINEYCLLTHPWLVTYVRWLHLEPSNWPFLFLRINHWKSVWPTLVVSRFCKVAYIVVL